MVTATGAFRSPGPSVNDCDHDPLFGALPVNRSCTGNDDAPDALSACATAA
jgi:hypothetical protein